jgi:imidazolonepropionase
MTRKLFRNGRIFTPADKGSPLCGRRQGDIVHFARGAIYTEGGVIAAIGDEEEVLAGLSFRQVDVEVDCLGRCIIPGFVDPHTHMCFAARREEEFILRLEGMDYLEILERGGGILSSVRAVRETSEAELFLMTRRHAESALRFGTTTLEIKSGYGLDTESELKMLRVIERIGRELPVDVVPTFLGAHAIPEEYAGAADRYVDLIVSEMIPAVSEQHTARFCDVFCEKSVFTVDQSRQILEAARKAGMGVKIHADEVCDLGGAALAADLRATSAEHLLRASDANIRAMAGAGVIGILLPATAYCLQKEYAPARKMVELGLPIAIATDCNPGTSYTESMPFVFGLSVLGMRLSISEALVASTLNAAYSIGMSHRTGSLDVGKSADFIILDGDSPAMVAYHAGVSPVMRVYKQAEPVGECRECTGGVNSVS